MADIQRHFYIKILYQASHPNLDGRECSQAFSCETPGRRWQGNLRIRNSYNRNTCEERYFSPCRHPGQVSVKKCQAVSLIPLFFSDLSYSLHCECINLLLVLLSVQMYSVKPANKSVMFKCIIQKSAIHALLLTKCLLNNFIRQDPLPQIGGSLILGLASGLWNALTFGYGRSSSDDGREPVLARLSLILLLVLTNHCTTEANAYREALFNCCDLKVDSIGSGSIVSGFKIDFAKLFITLSATQDQDQSTLLVYMLLHKNLSFRAFTISRTSELDNLVVPILKILYNFKEKSSHHIYMALIILLILSEDQLFNETLHDIVSYLLINNSPVSSNSFIHSDLEACNLVRRKDAIRDKFRWSHSLGFNSDHSIQYI